MLKDYLQIHKISLNSLAKSTGIAYSTLNDLSNGKVDIDNCRLGVARKLSDALAMSVDELYQICKQVIMVNIEKFDTVAELKVKNKTYFASFKCEGRDIELPICEVNRDSSAYICDFAKWDVEDYIQNHKKEGLNEVLTDEKG